MPEIVIRITVPGGVTVAVEQAPYSGPASSWTEPTDDIPWPAETINDAPQQPRNHAAAPMTTSVPSCPVHRVVMVHRPAGVSKKSGNRYPEFWACPERECDQTWNPPR